MAYLWWNDGLYHGVRSVHLLSLPSNSSRGSLPFAFLHICVYSEEASKPASCTSCAAPAVRCNFAPSMASYYMYRGYLHLIQLDWDLCTQYGLTGDLHNWYGLIGISAPNMALLGISTPDMAWLGSLHPVWLYWGSLHLIWLDWDLCTQYGFTGDLCTWYGLIEISAPDMDFQWIFAPNMAWFGSLHPMWLYWLSLHLICLDSDERTRYGFSVDIHT